MLLCGLSLVASGGFSLVAVADPHYGGISVAEHWLEGTQALVAAHVGSVVVAHWLWTEVNSHGTHAWLLCGMWDLSGSGIEA